MVAVCGSLPPGAPTDLHARLIATARELGAFTILDCSTPAALAAGLAAGPDLVAPNLGEAGALLGVELGPGPRDPELAADRGRDPGARSRRGVAEPRTATAACSRAPTAVFG